MTISVERVGHSFAARVAGLDLTQPLDPGQVSQIEAGMDEHAVLIDPAQITRHLVEHATQPCFVYVHRWEPYELVMWDNRQTMHRVRRFDVNTVRDMRRTTVAGDAPAYRAAPAA